MDADHKKVISLLQLKHSSKSIKIFSTKMLLKAGFKEQFELQCCVDGYCGRKTIKNNFHQ